MKNALLHVAKAVVAFGVVAVAPMAGVVLGGDIAVAALKEAATASLIEAIIAGGLVWATPNKP